MTVKAKKKVVKKTSSKKVVEKKKTTKKVAKKTPTVKKKATKKVVKKEVKAKTSNLPLIENDGYLAPHGDTIRWRHQRIYDTEKRLSPTGKIVDFANGHKYYGLHKEETEWVFREWAPNATEIFLVGNFSDGMEDERFRLTKINDAGVWELRVPLTFISNLDYYRLNIYWPGGFGERIPSYARFVVQDPTTYQFCARVWEPESRYQFQNPFPDMRGKAPLIYEAHIGMSQEEGKVGSYEEFRRFVLPRIAKAGYNTIQIMAIQEHPYYGSFGYQVSNFFAPCSRFGGPEELKKLIDEAHANGIAVIMDIVHSHAVKNENEGLSKFDGTSFQYFHGGGKGDHPAWDTKCFNYGKDEVLHFLLSNCKYWLEEFNFDGFRFDGVTSMLYFHHGLGKGFSTYHDYHNHEVDEDAVLYFGLVNKLIHDVRPTGISIAEDVSGMPGLASSLDYGGYGFDYRLAMGIPDFWIKLLKEKSDNDWNMEHIFYELINRRKDEKVISYAESHDQALVGDKTLIFWLIDKDMYWHMSKFHRNLVVDRGIALHKMIRMMTITTARGGYLNFMGNEFGHPEWIDFPREGNGWSYHYCRRQWSLQDDTNLCYEFLANFDREMIALMRDHNILAMDDPYIVHVHCSDHVVAFKRGEFIFVFNFHPEQSFVDYSIKLDAGSYEKVLDSDALHFGGQGRVAQKQTYFTNGDGRVSLYVPSRTMIVLRKK